MVAYKAKFEAIKSIDKESRELEEFEKIREKLNDISRRKSIKKRKAESDDENSRIVNEFDVFYNF